MLPIDNILIAVVTKGTDIQIDLLRWLFKMKERYGKLNVVFFCHKMSQVENYIFVHEYMLEMKQYSHVFICMTDVVMKDEEALDKLYEADKDIIGPPIWFADNQRRLIHTFYYPLNPQDPYKCQMYVRSNELIKHKKGIEEVCSITFACALIKRGVFEAFSDEPMFAIRDKHGATLYDPDQAFPLLAKPKGFKFYMHHDIKGAEHYGMVKLSDSMVEDLRDERVFNLFEHDRKTGYASDGEDEYRYMRVTL